MKRWLVVVLALGGLSLGSAPSEAGIFRSRMRGSCGSCCDVGCAPACNTCSTSYTYESRTIMVPQMVTETQTVKVMENKFETRSQKVTRYRSVPVTEQVPYTYTVMQPETRTRTENYQVCVPVSRAETRSYTVMVPQQEKRTGTRQVARVVAETVSVPVTRDRGRWEERCVERPCATACNTCCPTGGRRGLFGRRFAGYAGDCGVNACCEASCAPATTTVMQRVWVPSCVTTTEQRTVNRVRCETENFEYTCTVMKPETRQQTVNVTSYEMRPQSREVSCTVMVPKTQTGTRAVTTCKTESYEETVNYTVCVPQQVQRQVQVQVCKMVPRTIQVCVPVTTCAPAGLSGACAAGSCVVGSCN